MVTSPQVSWLFFKAVRRVGTKNDALMPRPFVEDELRIIVFATRPIRQQCEILFPQI
jgi:hypothetical protein